MTIDLDTHGISLFDLESMIEWIYCGKIYGVVHSGPGPQPNFANVANFAAFCDIPMLVKCCVEQMLHRLPENEKLPMYCTAIKTHGNKNDIERLKALLRGYPSLMDAFVREM